MPPEMTASRLSRAEPVREKQIKLGGYSGYSGAARAAAAANVRGAYGSELTPMAKPRADRALVKALARAWRWQELPLR